MACTRSNNKLLLELSLKTYGVGPWILYCSSLWRKITWNDSDMGISEICWSCCCQDVNFSFCSKRILAPFLSFPWSLLPYLLSSISISCLLDPLCKISLISSFVFFLSNFVNIPDQVVLHEETSGSTMRVFSRSFSCVKRIKNLFFL